MNAPWGDVDNKSGRYADLVLKSTKSADRLSRSRQQAVHDAALDAIVDGTLGASVESSPFFGPIAFATMDQYINGEEIPDWVKVEDRFFDESNAAEFQGTQY